MNYFKTALLAISFIFLNRDALHAQHDSTYYVSYSKLLTARLYFSQKYTALTVKNKNDNYTLHYRPNTTLKMGLGASYKWATLNLAYGFGFLNPEENKGKTKYVDLQFHAYGQKFNLDVLGQFYKGFYLYPKGGLASDPYYNRPDLRVTIIGASFQYVFNHKRFSFRSTILQNEWQKKSAGTVLLGIEAYGGRIMADSTLVPAAINQGAAALNEKKMSFFETGPNLGYAYTLVIHENFFLTGSASVSFDYGFSTVTTEEGESRRYSFSPNTFLRVSAGYNSAKWAFNVFYVNNGVRLASPNNGRESTLNSGNLRLTYVRRFTPGRKEKKHLKKESSEFSSLHSKNGLWRN